MEVIPAKPACHIHTFADEIETRLVFCHHRFGGERSGIHPADHHFCCAIPLGACGGELPLGEAFGETVQLLCGEIGNTFGQCEIVQH